MYPCLATFFSSERRTGRLCRELTWTEFGLNYMIYVWKGGGWRWMLQMIYRKSCPWRSTRASFSVALNAQFTVHCKENPISVFLFYELLGLSPNFHSPVSVSDLKYIFQGLVHIFPCSRIGRPGNIKISHRYMSIGTGRQNIIICFGNNTFISGST